MYNNIIYYIVFFKIIIILLYQQNTKNINNIILYKILYLYNEIINFNKKNKIDNNWGQFIIIDNDNSHNSDNNSEINWFSDTNDY